MRVKILQVVAGKGVTGAQIKDAIVVQVTTEEQYGALFDLFECRASKREIRALQLQLQEHRSLEEEDSDVPQGEEDRESTGEFPCCPWESKSWSEQCVNCRQRRDKQ